MRGDRERRGGEHLDDGDGGGVLALKHELSRGQRRRGEGGEGGGHERGAQGRRGEETSLRWKEQVSTAPV
jgi:hypothetical protein